MITTATLPTALTDSLARLAAVEPAATERLSAELGALLTPLEHSPWPEVAWRFSRLTGNGFPVELAFTSAGDGVRATCEIAGPELADDRRLATALELLGARGVDVPPALGSQLHGVQAAAPLRWGAWLGVRCSADGARYKLYAEATAGPHGQWVPPSVARAERRMIGWDATDRLQELYYRLPGTDTDVLDALVRRCGLGRRTGELLEVVDACSRRSAVRVLASRQVGFSVVLSPDGAASVFSFFVAARVLCGGGARVRPVLADLARRHGWDLRHYFAAAAPAEHHARAETAHGMVALVLAPGRPVQLQVGLRPVHDTDPR